MRNRWERVAKAYYAMVEALQLSATMTACGMGTACFASTSR